MDYKKHWFFVFALIWVAISMTVSGVEAWIHSPDYLYEMTFHEDVMRGIIFLGLVEYIDSKTE